MPEKQLSDRQRERIEKIKAQWKKDVIEQVETIPETDDRILDGPKTRKLVELERKYRPMIQAIMQEEN